MDMSHFQKSIALLFCLINAYRQTQISLKQYFLKNLKISEDWHLNCDPGVNVSSYICDCFINQSEPSIQGNEPTRASCNCHLGESLQKLITPTVSRDNKSRHFKQNIVVTL